MQPSGTLTTRLTRSWADPGASPITDFTLSRPQGFLGTRHARVLCALAVGLEAAGVVELHWSLPEPGRSDFLELWRGMAAFLEGKDPYATVRALHPDVALYYPFPALLLFLPLAWLPPVHAEAVFVGLGMAALAYAGWGRPLLAACISSSALASVMMGQWSPLMTASAVVPALGFVWACKPSVGAVLAAGYVNRTALVGSVLFTVVSTAIWPGWIVSWLPGLHGSVHVPPLLRPGGIILLLSLLRWRRPEARMLAALACVPQTGMLYDTLPLFLIPRSRWQAYALVACTHLAAVVIYLRSDVQRPLVEEVAVDWPVLLALCYLPTLIMLLRPDRAEARADARLEPRLRRLDV